MRFKAIRDVGVHIAALDSQRMLVPSLSECPSRCYHFLRILDICTSMDCPTKIHYELPARCRHFLFNDLDLYDRRVIFPI